MKSPISDRLSFKPQTRRVHIPVADYLEQTFRFLDEQVSLAAVCLCRSSIAFDSMRETDRIRPMSCICKVLETSHGLPEALREFWIYVNLRGFSPLIVGSAHDEFSRYEVGPQCCRVLLVLSTHPSAQAGLNTHRTAVRFTCSRTACKRSLRKWRPA